MHAAAGAAYEAALGERTVEHADRVATHFFEAGNRDRAGALLRAIGQRKLSGRHYEAAARDNGSERSSCAICRGTPRPSLARARLPASAVYRARTARESTQLMGQLLSHIDRRAIWRRASRRGRSRGHLVSTHDFEAADAYLEGAKRLADGNPL